MSTGTSPNFYTIVGVRPGNKLISDDRILKVMLSQTFFDKNDFLILGRLFFQLNPYRTYSNGFSSCLVFTGNYVPR
jgi:hypothetical protein